MSDEAVDNIIQLAAAAGKAPLITEDSAALAYAQILRRIPVRPRHRLLVSVGRLPLATGTHPSRLCLGSQSRARPH